MIDANFGAEDTIKANTVLQISFAERYSFQIDSYFASNFGAVYSALYAQASVIPISPPGVVPGQKVAVIDANNKKDRTGLNLLTALTAVQSPGVIVTKVRALSQAEKTQATSDAGAEARAAARGEAEKAANASDFINGILARFQSLGKTVTLVLLVLVVLYIFSQRKT